LRDHRASSTRVLAYGLHLGARLPAHATSTGRALIAAKSKADFNAWMKGRELARLTARTTVDPRKFRALIEEVRVQDFCVAGEEHELGVQALAVPLRNLQGQAVAALNVIAAPHRVEPRAMQRNLLPLLLDAARELRPLL
jgi:IclR family transcriptional regulator, pca regulon regulatory protein